jgi:hypothetical protein
MPTVIPLATTSSTLTFTELEEVGAVENPPDCLYRWNKAALHSLFGLEEWENTQLYGVLDQLGLLNCDHTIAGGSLVRHLMKTDIFRGDIDIYPKDGGEADKLKRVFQDKGYKVEKSLFSYWFEHKTGAKKIKVQIMHKTANTMAGALGLFDFEHVRVAYRLGSFHSTLGATTAIAQKQLHLRHITEPNYTLLRALKYKRLGFDADKAITQLAIMINRGEKNINATEWEPKNPIVEY